jgi:hypothetical protein
MLGSARSVLIKKPAPPAFPAPAAAYGFSEGSGTTTADSSGNGNTLTLASATWNPSGHTGSALSNTSDFTVGASTTSFSNLGTIFTMMTWVNPIALPNNGTGFAAGFIQTSGSTNIGIFTQRAYVTFNVLQINVRVSNNVNVVTGPALTVGVWTHVAVTYDGTTIRLYKDGSEVSFSNVSGTLSTGSPFYVAGANSDAGFGSNVTVDDVRFFNVVLTPTQIVAAMNTPVS